MKSPHTIALKKLKSKKSKKSHYKEHPIESMRSASMNRQNHKGYADRNESVGPSHDDARGDW